MDTNVVIIMATIDEGGYVAHSLHYAVEPMLYRNFIFCINFALSSDLPFPSPSLCFGCTSPHIFLQQMKRIFDFFFGLNWWIYYKKKVMQLKHLLKPTINYNLAKQSYTLSKYKYNSLKQTPSNDVQSPKLIF